MILLQELWHCCAWLILIVSILKNFPGPPVCLDLPITGQPSQSGSPDHHRGFVAYYGWLSQEINRFGCIVFSLFHLLDFLIKIFPLVLVLDVNQVE